MFKNILCKNRDGSKFEPSPEQRFLYTMEIIHTWLEEESESLQKNIILDYMMDVIREDLKTSVMTTIFYREEHFKDYDRRMFFPMSYYNENGEELKIYGISNKESININLKDECVIAIPWNRKRMKKAVKEIYIRDFVFDPYNHESTYYTPINVCHIECGNHSIAAGIGYAKGRITSKKVDISEAFPHLFSDGAYWYNVHTKRKLYPVFDFRIAILFELAKLKNNIE
ncbi:DUF6710 family protein [Bacillus sp. SIMBA_074]|uniref:DUF6710 family protein n=1 Tax=Bacillus TaxID=1386 RepID=UPI000BEE47AB|nr:MULTISPECIES: DUF6710 family protein [Bacillus]PEB59719.1 hypothetical protein COM79_03440 [Bacillus cereus]PFN37741.1 hypothetical protein COJ56_21775 [Bacillus thuringiensis]WNV17584.1 DUF6710 family protein [Bacillus sp. SI2]HDX9705977.1 hypothetical protein [Bacillus thuringiensis]